MSEKKIVGYIQRKTGYLYYIDGDGKIWQCKLNRSGKKKKKKNEKGI